MLVCQKVAPIARDSYSSRFQSQKEFHYYDIYAKSNWCIFNLKNVRNTTIFTTIPYKMTFQFT
jgi:hypothetical protein